MHRREVWESADGDKRDTVILVPKISEPTTYQVLALGAKSIQSKHPFFSSFSCRMNPVTETEVNGQF